MTYQTYQTYQCSICRRKKSLLNDDVRAQVSHCTITKGCNGTLHIIGESQQPINTPPAPGLVDWYPRGQAFTTVPPAPLDTPTPISNSSLGAVVLALNIPELDAPSSVILQMRQRLTADVPFTEYSFIAQAENNVISGKDLSGRNLRFDQTAINEERIQVQVDGIVRTVGDGTSEYQIVPDVITFNSMLTTGSRVTILVFGITPTTVVTVRLSKNDGLTLLSGAWGNIRWIEEFNLESSDYDRSLLYTANTTGGISSEAQYKLESIYDEQDTNSPIDLSDAKFLLSNSPYSNVDRNLYAFVECSPLSEDFILRSSTVTYTELYVPQSRISDIAPPLRLIGGGQPASNNSYITEDSLTNGSTTVESVPRTSNKILGPV